MDRDRIVRLDRAHVWRPYTSSEDHATRDDFVIVETEGPFLIDADGRRYLDATASWWCASLGYRHPRLVKALTKQAAVMPHVGMGGATHPQAAELAAELVEVAPKGDRALERVFFSDDGSTSVEVALKMAFQGFAQNGETRRTRFLALPGGYHGDTIGAMSLGELDEFAACFEPLLFGKNDAEPVQDPSDWGAVFDGLVGELEARGDTVAAVVVEPILQGAAGMRLYPAEQLQRLRRACDAAGCLLIADEVFTGFGRTGRMWACEHAGVVPDLLCTSKALSGGLLPFAATLATGAVYDRFRGDATRALLHGHTFFGNPLGAAVAREVLAVYREEEILAKAQAKASRVAACFQRLGELPGARRARWLGMMGAVDLGDEGYFGTKGWEVWREAKRRGVSLRPLGDTVYVTPPLNLEDGMLEELLGVVEASVGAVLAAG